MIPSGALDSGDVGHRRSLIMIGVVLLLINPVVRVAFAAFGFAAQGDRLYTADQPPCARRSSG